jgi:hypothetical protein
MILFFSSKWLIWTLSKLKLACSLKQVDKEIIAKAEMHMEEQHLLAKQGVCPTRLEEMAKPIREKLHQLHIHLKCAVNMPHFELKKVQRSVLNCKNIKQIYYIAKKNFSML